MGKKESTMDSVNEAKPTKTSVNIKPENMEKINKIIEDSGGVITKSEVINKAIAGVPIILLGDRKSIAECFVDIRNALTDADMRMVREEARAVCQSLNLLMEKIEEISH